MLIRKGVDKMLFVCAEFLKLNPNYKIHIMGSTGEGTEYLKGLISDLNIGDSVTFTGRISEEEKIDTLKRSRFYFQLSLYEGFGVAAVEGLATGNVVVHSGKGGLKDSVGNNGPAC